MHFRFLSVFLSYLHTRSAVAMSQVGTPLYMSPETLQGQGHELVSDIWSLGCVLYELAMLTSPFYARHLTMDKVGNFRERAFSSASKLLPTFSGLLTVSGPNPVALHGGGCLSPPPPLLFGLGYYFLFTWWKFEGRYLEVFRVLLDLFV